MLKLLVGLLFLFGRRLGARFLLVIICASEVLLWLGGVVCVGVMERMWFICCCIVQWLESFGASFVGYLG